MKTTKPTTSHPHTVRCSSIAPFSSSSDCGTCSGDRLKQEAETIGYPVLMIRLGAVAFGEWPPAMVYCGAAIIILAGCWLVWDQTAPARRAARVVPAE